MYMYNHQCRGFLSRIDRCASITVSRRDLQRAVLRARHTRHIDDVIVFMKHVIGAR